ncbi:MAG: type II toxin-antitoxin system prevent-host-death family antitoxin [Leptospiraceae bacterium]|nr:type II toxin-antitoxin system prevent-host-death family antitoxin [Leptospiraceae bacterium]MCP5511105.1 type II toxin-antitoxin system prevent-host-death family antitoxin [Leptospiraceae bacterium]
MNQPNHYNVAEAKARFSEILQRSMTSPQFISNRGRDVGVVISIESYKRLIDREEKSHPTTKIKNFIQLSLSLADTTDLSLELDPRTSRDIPELGD